jgi:beta-1,4-mannooligosaccharide/beta-1,4-mannosyl-N-acetylglucosamine phosphorylase
MIFNKHHRPTMLFKRFEGNPVLTPDCWPYPANATFNPGAIRHDGETYLVVRVEDMRGFSHLTLARSKDGKTGWQIDEKPIMTPDSDFHEERWGIEDPRIVWLEELEQYAMTYVSFSKDGPVVSLALSKDLQNFKRRGAMLPPEDKDASLFPRKINRRYVLIHRPIIRGEAHMWIANSPDLVHWGEHKILLPVRPGWWDSTRVGLGPPPIETDEGWLIIYHGVRMTASGSLYRVGLALLDLEEPWKIIKRTDQWVFGPHEAYERVGDVPGVTFPTGIVHDPETDELIMYYGAADTSVCLATVKLKDLVDYVLSCNDSTEEGFCN